jgi:hypothetical protein
MMSQPHSDNLAQKFSSRNMKSIVSVALLPDPRHRNSVDTEIRRNGKARQNKRKTNQILQSGFCSDDNHNKNEALAQSFFPLIPLSLEERRILNKTPTKNPASGTNLYPRIEKLYLKQEVILKKTARKMK